jgi:hypothetical protein
MKQIIKRCSNIGSDVLGFVRIGNNSITIINKDKNIKGILNGCELFKVSNIKDDKDNVAYVIGDLIQNIYNKGNCENFTIYKNLWANDKYPMGEILEHIILNLKDNIKVAVKVRSKEANINFENSFNFGDHINANVLNKNINTFNTKMSNACIVLQSFIKYASIISGHKFGNNGDVWGAKNIQKYMDGIRFKIASYNSEISKIDFYKEMLYRNSKKLSMKLSSVSIMNNAEEKKIISQVLIPDIIDNYEKVKDLSTQVVFIVSPLIYVDDLFRKNTNYPVTWFVSDDVIMNLKEDYNFLINFLQEMPKIEANAIMPLDFYSDSILK